MFDACVLELWPETATRGRLINLISTFCIFYLWHCINLPSGQSSHKGNIWCTRIPQQCMDFWDTFYYKPYSISSLRFGKKVAWISCACEIMGTTFHTCPKPLLCIRLALCLSCTEKRSEDVIKIWVDHKCHNAFAQTLSTSHSPNDVFVAHNFPQSAFCCSLSLR